MKSTWLSKQIKNGCLLCFFLFSMQLLGQTWIEDYEVGQGSYTIEAINGDFIMVGYHSSNRQHFLKRVDAEGDEIWHKNLPTRQESATFQRLFSKGDDTYIFATSVHYLGGAQMDSIQILEFHNAGTIVWQKGYSSFHLTTFRFMTDIINTSDGGFLLSIAVPHDEDSNDNIDNSLLVKLDSTGTLVWENIVEDIRDSKLLQIEEDNFVLAGAYHGDVVIKGISSDGHVLWSNTFDSGSTDSVLEIEKVDDHQLAILALWDGFLNENLLLQPVISNTLNIIKTNTVGDSIFSKTIESSLPIPYSLRNKMFNIRAYGGFDILLDEYSSFGNKKLQIIQLDENGNRINENNWLHHAFGTAMVACQDGGYVVTGELNGSKVFIAKADTAGQFNYHYLQGNIFKDDNTSCVLETSEIGLRNWIVSIKDSHSENIIYTTTDNLGNYSVNIYEGDYEVTALISHPVWESCAHLNPQAISIDSSPSTTVINFPMQPLYECAIMNVEISTPLLRRCYDNTYYVEYCNKGTETAENAFVKIILDEFLTINAATLPDTHQGDSSILFSVGDVAIGECGQFSIDTYLDCDNTVLGQSHCSVAHIYPDSICFPTDPDWDFSSISVTGVCEQDSVRFFIKNEGTGDMDEPSIYHIVIDELIMLQGVFQLDSGEAKEVAVEALAQTYRMDVQQSPGHPGNSMPSATVEDCPDFGALSFLNWFSQNDLDNFIDIDCRQNVGSYDPNDKQAFPRGYGDEHQIEPQTNIEYLIRFQNTGTDTAFRVVVRDTLSDYLDLSTFKMDVASHPYKWEIFGQGVLKVTFDNIMLPDSSANEAASHGFFRYSVQAKAGVPLGTKIENRAGIYFDFNLPIITNTVFHTIDKKFIEVDIKTPTSNEEVTAIHSLRVMPNPFSNFTIFKSATTYRELRLEVFDMTGKLLTSVRSSGDALKFEKKNLPTGMYFFKVQGDGRYLGNGKILIQN